MTNDTKIYTCRCGELDGVEHCEWTGDLDDLVLVEYMPAQLRASHTAAGSSGIYPANGSIRAAIHYECAELLDASEEDAQWYERLDRPTDIARYAEEVV